MKSPLQITLISAFSFAIFGKCFAQNPTIGDPGFEQPAIPPAAFVQRDAANGGVWTFSNFPATMGAGITHLPSPFSTLLAPEGNQVAMLQGQSRFHQNINFPATGAYLISFKLASRVNQPNFSGAQHYEIRVDDVPIHSETTVPGMPFTDRETPFIVSEGTHTITFVGLSPDDQTAFFDDINIIPKPGFSLITSLHNTGVISDNDLGLGAALRSPGGSDSNYKLVSPIQAQAIAIKHNSAWKSNGPNSSWIGHDEYEVLAPAGEYVYETRFSLPSNAKLSSVRLFGLIVADNGYEVFLNNVSLGPPHSQEYSFPDYRFLNPAPGSFPYLHGENVLKIVVTNTLSILPSGESPTGLRIDQLRGIFEIDSEIGTEIPNLMINNAIELKWIPQATGRYQIQYSENLESNSWQNFGPEIIGGEDPIRAFDSVENVRRFYRVLVLPASP